MRAEELPYYRELEVISSVLHERVQGFPKRGCKIAAGVVEQIIGIPEVAGTYRFTQSGGVADDRRPETHHWNRDSKLGIDIDLSQHQYQAQADEPIPAITVLPMGSPQLLLSGPKPLSERASVEEIVTEVRQRLRTR